MKKESDRLIHNMQRGKRRVLLGDWDSFVQWARLVWLAPRRWALATTL